MSDIAITNGRDKGLSRRQSIRSITPLYVDDLVLWLSGDSVTTTTTSHLFLSESDFSNGAWTKLNTTVSTNVGTDPDGGSNADRITETANAPTAEAHAVFQAFSDFLGNKTYRFSVYAKYVDRDFISLWGDNTGVAAWFNLSTGQIAGNAGTNYVSHSMEDVGDGWYKCNLDFIPTSSGICRIYLSNQSAVISYSVSAGNEKSIDIYKAEIVCLSETVSKATDLTSRGNSFIQSTEASRPILNTWPNNNKPCWSTINNKDFLTIPTNSDLAVTDESWILAMSVEVITFTAFEVYFGNGHAATANQGYRCFLNSTGFPLIYASSDGTGPMTSSPSFNVTANTRRVIVWGVDGPSGGDCVFALNGTAVERINNIRGYPISNGGLNITCGGGHGTIGYIPGGKVRQVGFWKRPSTESFTDAEILKIVNIFAEDAGL